MSNRNPQSQGAPSVSATSQVGTVEPEFFRIPAAVRFSGLSRSHIYFLIKTGAIRSTSIRRRGALRGVRLISRESLIAFIGRHTA